MIWAIVATVLMNAVELPMGSAPDPVAMSHFPDRLHAYVWRNWQLVPPDRLASVVGAEPAQILDMGRRMGLDDPPPVTDEQWRRSHITIIRANWHLLPYEQLLALLDWTPDHMAYILREDDFLYVKLGQLKPKCAPLAYAEPDAATRAREDAIAATVRQAFPGGVLDVKDPLFGFVAKLSEMPSESAAPVESRFSPRYCYSYFALYGDVLADTKADSYPEGYLARLAAAGVNGVWLQGVLFKLSPFPWDPALSEGYETRLTNLRALVARAKKHGIGIYLYMNEPRSMPISFFESHPELKGVAEGDWAAMCTSVDAVKDYIRTGIAHVVREVPDLAGIFTISASENLTNCWSHHQGAKCPRCNERGAETVVAEVNTLIREGIAAAGPTKARLLAWDWGWQDPWAEGIIRRLPKDVALMSVSEWSIPIKRGGVDSMIAEYSISEVGPGPRATRHWGFARENGLDTIAKVQANNTWEISSVPYIPAVENVARHAANLRDAGVNGLMLSWTLGGYPSPNLEIFAEMGRKDAPSIDQALTRVAARRFGDDLAPDVVAAWKAYSAAFSEFPYDSGSLYTGPQQMGPANPLWEKPTGYAATMVGMPYDAVTRWHGVYGPDVYVAQCRKIADGFEAAIGKLEVAAKARAADISPTHAAALAAELDVARVCGIHFRSCANQTEFVIARDALAAATDSAAAQPLIAKIEAMLQDEIRLAITLHAIQTRDSRFGYEASNHYFYVPTDLAEKVVNCRDLLDRWLPEQKRAHGLGDVAAMNNLSYTVRRAKTEPALDGNWDGPAWQDAPTLDVSNFREGSDHRPKTQARVLYAPDALFVAFRVEDRYVRCLATEYQGAVYQDACVEFFVEPKPGKGYFNFEMNCGGALLLRHITNPDRSGPGGELAGFKEIPKDLAAGIKVFHSMPTKIEPEMDEPVTWIVQYKIPLSIFEPSIGPVGNPAGQTWRANFYKCAENNSHPHYASWSPVGGPLNFHQPKYFAPIKFEP